MLKTQMLHCLNMLTYCASSSHHSQKLEIQSNLLIDADKVTMSTCTTLHASTVGRIFSALGYLTYNAKQLRTLALQQALVNILPSAIAMVSAPLSHGFDHLTESRKDIKNVLGKSRLHCADPRSSPRASRKPV